MKSMFFKTIKYTVSTLVFFAFMYFISVNVSAGDLSLHAIYVGKADCLLIESNKHYMLVDSGYTSSSEDVLNYLDAQDIPNKKIDYAIASHPDGDHVGGFANVFDNYSVNQVIYSPCTKASVAYSNFINAVKSRGIPFRTPIEGESWKLGDATVTVIYDGSQGTTYNECSIILRVECDGKSILLTGDLPSVTEKLLLEQGYTFQADILKIGHHGAASSTSAEFLDAVKPSYAVICCSNSPTAVLPRAKVLKRLAKRFIKTYRTSDGNVLISIKDGVISTESKENNGYVCITNGTITLSNNVFYAKGSKLKPKVTLTVDGAVIPSTQYKVTYSSNKYVGTANVKVKGTEEKYVGTLRTTFLILPGTETLNCSLAGLNDIVLNWNSWKNVSGYTIVYTTDKSFKTGLKYINVSKASSVTKILSNLPYSTTYYFKIRAYKSNLGFGKWSKIKSVKTASDPTPRTQKIRKIRLGKHNHIKLKWKILSKDKATGYQIQCSTSKKFKKNITTVKVKNKNTNVKVFKKLEAGKTYYFRLRGYNKYATGKWSKTVSIKLKK